MNTVARLETARLNKGQPVFQRVAMEYIDNDAYTIREILDSYYDMWDYCCIQCFSYGNRNGQYPGTPTDRIKVQGR